MVEGIQQLSDGPRVGTPLANGSPFPRASPISPALKKMANADQAANFAGYPLD